MLQLKTKNKLLFLLPSEMVILVRKLTKEIILETIEIDAEDDVF